MHHSSDVNRGDSDIKCTETDTVCYKTDMAGLKKKGPGPFTSPDSLISHKRSFIKIVG